MKSPIITRIIAYSFILILVILIVLFATKKITLYNQEALQYQQNIRTSTQEYLQLENYRETIANLNLAKEKYPAEDFTDLENKANSIRAALYEKNLNLAIQYIIELNNSLDLLTQSASQMATLFGTVKGTSELKDISVKIYQKDKLVESKKSDKKGSFSFYMKAGPYTIKINQSGYNSFSKEIDLKKGENQKIAISLTKKQVFAATPAPIAAPPVAISDGLYSRKSVVTSRGTFTVYLLTIPLSSYKMIVDTAADSDCANNCPVISLSQFVSRNGGVAGIHGTYFCPASYSACSSEINSFFFKLYNTRLQKKINWSNGLGDYLPLLSISPSGYAQYYSTWYQARNNSFSAAISCRPHLVENGKIVLTASDMDSDKESVLKSSHGFIGLRGQTIYAGIVTGANLYDSAAVSLALGLENSFNLDGGGTSALFSSGSYKVGPGRNMPNAIIFKKK